MNKLRIPILLILLFTAFSCKKDDAAPASTFPTTPEAQSINDDKSGGVYKGAVVGSTGSIKIVLQKGVKEIQLTIDGVSKTLTTDSLSSWTSGEIVRNAVFKADDWKVVFNVGATGIGATVVLTIPGHTGAEAILFKETSKALVRSFDGTYAGSESGTWNFIIRDAELSGISRSTDGQTISTFAGLVNENTITLLTIGGSGTISGDDASGTWQGSTADVKGTWVGKRVL